MERSRVPMSDIVANFAELFEGRRDAYGSGDAGACIRTTPETWEHLWRAHLNGARALGVYPMTEGGSLHDTGWFVKWGCVDWDIKSPNHVAFDYETEDECHVAAVNLQKVLTHFGVTSWIERTRSGGRHLWTFAETWVSASVMRRALMVGCAVAGVSSREVNPKSEALSEGQLGNYVRLPYPGIYGTRVTTQCIVDEAGVLPSFEYFVTEALARRTPIATLEEIAAKYAVSETVRSTPRIEFEPYEIDDSFTYAAYAYLNRQGQSVFRDGGEYDRSNALVYVARQAQASSLTPDQALALLYSMDDRCGKFVDRPDRDKRLKELVEYAWNA